MLFLIALLQLRSALNDNTPENDLLVRNDVFKQFADSILSVQENPEEVDDDGDSNN